MEVNSRSDVNNKRGCFTMCLIDLRKASFSQRQSDFQQVVPARAGSLIPIVIPLVWGRGEKFILAGSREFLKLQFLYLLL